MFVPVFYDEEEAHFEKSKAGGSTWLNLHALWRVAPLCVFVIFVASVVAWLVRFSMSCSEFQCKLKFCTF